MITPELSEGVLVQIRADSRGGAPLRRLAMERLGELDGYDWCGVYRLEGDTLILDEFVGELTEHTEIAVGVGVCGTAVAEREDQIVEDVRALTNYLSCSLLTRSEIVVLIRRGELILGQIDIDGHRVGQFDESDEMFLRRLAELLAERWE